MRKPILIFGLILLSPILSHAQNRGSQIKLEYIKDLTIEADGIVCHYTFDSTQLPNTNRQYILFVTGAPNRRAVMKVSGKSTDTFLYPISKKVPVGGIDTSTFIGGGYKIKLDTRKQKILDDNFDIYSGTLTITHNKEISRIKIHGTVEVYLRNKPKKQ